MLIASQLSLSIDTLPWLPLRHMIQLDSAFTFLNVNALSNYLIALSVKFMSTVHTDIDMKYLLLTEFEGCNVSYGGNLFPHRFMAQG